MNTFSQPSLKQEPCAPLTPFVVPTPVPDLGTSA